MTLNEFSGFYGLHPRYTRADQLFKFFALPDAVAGAYIAGQVYDEASGMTQLVHPAGLLGIFFIPWVRRMVRRRTEHEALYDGLAPGSDEFLAADSRNFVIHRTEIDRVVIRRRKAFWTMGAGNSGSIEIILWSGRKQKYVLVGDQDVNVIEGLLTSSLGSVQIIPA